MSSVWQIVFTTPPEMLTAEGAGLLYRKKDAGCVELYKIIQLGNFCEISAAHLDAFFSFPIKFLTAVSTNRFVAAAY